MWRHSELTFLRTKEKKLLLQSRCGMLTVSVAYFVSHYVRDVSCYLQCNIVHSVRAEVASLNLKRKRRHFLCSNTHMQRVEVGNLLKFSQIIPLRYVCDWTWGPTSFLNNVYRVSCPGVMRLGRGVDQRPHIARVLKNE
jgi:hypothetical protein